jgi:predicted nucleotidyltransferase
MAGLAVMKLISWNEGFPERGKDAEDLHFIAENSLDARNDDRLSADASDLIRMEPFDRVLAGARLHGRDMHRLVGEEARRKITTILTREAEPSGELRLLGDMVGTNVTKQENPERIQKIIDSLRQGSADEASRS